MTIIPIFFKASTIGFAFLSLTLFEEMLRIRKGENLSLFFIIMDSVSSVSSLFDKFMLEVLPRKSMIFENRHGPAILILRQNLR